MSEQETADRLREALDAVAGGVRTRPDAYERALGEWRRRERRRRITAVVLAGRLGAGAGGGGGGGPQPAAGRCAPRVPGARLGHTDRREGQVIANVTAGALDDALGVSATAPVLGGLVAARPFAVPDNV